MPPLDDAALQEIFAQRWAAPEPRTALEQIVPDAAVRAVVSDRIARTIQQADDLRPDRWGFSDRFDLLRVNVGPAEAILIVHEVMRLMIHEATARASGLEQVVETLDPTPVGIYRSIPESVFISIPTDIDASEVKALLDRFAPAHERHVALALGKGLNGMTRRGHHPGLVDAVAAAAGVTLPQPSYVRVLPPPVLAEPVSDSPSHDTEASDESHPVPEGRRVEVTLTRVERNRSLRRQCLEHHGVRCAVCDLDMGEAYGPDAAGLIHVHHLNPVAQGERDTDPKTDLVPVCPNCHMVIHAGEVLRSVGDVRAMRDAARAGTA